MIKRKKIKRILMDYIIITIASIVYGLGTSLFSDPNNLAPGGFTGVAIAMNRLAPIGTGTWFMLMNIPVLLLGVWKFGFRFIISTLYATGIISLSTNMFAQYGQAYMIHDVFLAITIGSACCAWSMGVIFKHGATTGGSDIIIKLLRLKFPHIKTGMLFFITDIFVVIFAGFVFGNIDDALYSLLAVLITSFILDIVLYGRDEARLLYIISDRSEPITRRLLEELDIGVTHIYGEGAYSHKQKKVIMCVVKKRVSPLAESIVKEEDPDAFMIVTSASEIFGEGYKSYFEEKI